MKKRKQFNIRQITSVSEVVGVSRETPMAKLLQEWGERLEQQSEIKFNKRHIQVSLPSSNVSLKLLRNCSILASKTSSLLL